MNPRTAKIEIVYEGVNISQDIAPFLVSLTYTDNGNGKADDLQILLEDRFGMWRDPWLPLDGDKIRVAIQPHNWYEAGDSLSLPCGTFQVDTVDLGGPPDTINIQAVSYPGNSSIKNEAVTKAWEKVTLSQIGSRIAAAAGLKFMFETQDVTYDRIDQTEQTDLAFLDRLTEQEGLTLKVTNDTLVIFDDRKYESMEPVRVLERGKSDILSYSFRLSTIGVAYASCQVSYKDSQKGRTIKGTFQVPGATGPVLKINERVTSEAEAIRKARNALRQTNKEAQRARMVLMGDPALVQGVTVQVKGFGKFDAKYIIDSATHKVGGGYETSLELRKVLTY